MPNTERKLKHIQACLLPESQYQSVSTGLEKVDWPYCALPEKHLEEIDISCHFLGKRLRAPLLIGAMTGGAEKGQQINRNLAQAAHNLGVGMMLGSQRIMLEDPSSKATFLVRELAPEILLIGNLGAAQFVAGYDVPEALAVVEQVQADALAIHINPLQEAIQAGGDKNWQGVKERLHEIVPQLPFCTILKEVGHGLDVATLRAVQGAGFSAYDIAGAGGTSWARVEQLVEWGRVASPDLCEVGIPTAQALSQARQLLPHAKLIASGGIRTGLDAARALHLGANLVAVARPLLEPALESAEAVEQWLERFIDELRTSLFILGENYNAHE